MQKQKRHFHMDRVYKCAFINLDIDHVINHKIFKRMNDIKQLGTISFYNKAAMHTRYEHSIGVGYLAYEAIKHLASINNKITEREILCVTLAGLCHDLGHGPFSHTFDHLLKKNVEFCPEHELRSQKLFRIIIMDLHKIGLMQDFDDECILLTQYFIDNTVFKKYIVNGLTEQQIMDVGYFPPCIDGLFVPGVEQIVSNQFCKLDVDKLDYIIRDNMVLNGPVNNANNDENINTLDIIKRCDISDGIWLFDHRDRLDIYEIVHRRQHQYLTIYLSKRSIITEAEFARFAKMAFSNDSSLLMCSELNTEEDIAQFCALTDDAFLQAIFERIECEDADALMDIINNTSDIVQHRHINDFVDRTMILKDASKPTRMLEKIRFHTNYNDISNF